MSQQPKRGTILECQNSRDCFLVLGDVEYVSMCFKVTGVQLMNLDTGEIEIERRDQDWWNWYFHPTGWDELR